MPAERYSLGDTIALLLPPGETLRLKLRGLPRYFYSGRLELETVTQAACTRTAAAKYLVPDLAERCLTFVRDHMGTEDVCPFLDYVLTMHEEDLDVTARAIILKDSIGVILSSSFTRSTELTVRYILRHVNKVPEVLVVKAVRDWAEQQCLTGSHGDGERADVRAVMLPFFSELRFLALTSAEFVQGPIAWNILTDAEALAILSNIIKEDSMAMPEGFCRIRKARK
ncbi:hypothetical protein HPB50_020529 [Hyalomma asiaticum]|uniref:Uncharacterized protein n=1 Tax=Hyalomma asiaticum TaxID=266040 RepID=A0ACB7TB67_HYAAI|nr:hypothetical protein HPB50_020529 [Hyalomma asiaticum]